MNAAIANKSQMVLEIARHNDIKAPVIIMLNRESSHARDVGCNLKKSGFPFVLLNEVTDDGGAEVMMNVDGAAQVLRQHCGAGGEYYARVLESHPTDKDFQVIGLLPDHIELTCVLDSVPTRCIETPYDEVNHDPIFDMAADPCVSMTTVKSPEGDVVPVCGPTGECMLSARIIVDVVTKGFIDLPFQGGLRRQTFDNNSLARFLDLFRHEPRAFAEAVMSLRKMKGHKDRRLLRVLWGDPNLRELATKVQRIILGTEVVE